MAYEPEKYWEERYVAKGNSGAGSSGEEAAWKTSQIVNAIRRLKVESILDLGSGDGQLALAIKRGLGHENVDYLGIELSATAIDIAKKRLSGNQKSTFIAGDFTELDLPQAELVLCLDVLFHLANDKKHRDAINVICRHFQKAAVVATWNKNIVTHYKGKFAAHTFFRPFVVPPDFSVEEKVIPVNPMKSLFVVTRK